MKRILVLMIIMFTTVNIAYSQKNGYKSEFDSEQQIREYYAKNLPLLDPIEGEYDVDGSGEYVTPFVHQYYPHNQFKVYIVSNNNQFKVYATVDGEFSESNLRVESIGETNAYWIYFHTSATRLYLQDIFHFTVNFKLDNASANEFTGNNRLSPAVDILLTNDFVKVYPTATMYASVIKKTEEAQPKEWTGTGFALNNNYIVTNNHVVDGAKTIKIQGINGDFNHKYNAEVIKVDKNNDLAIIKVNGVKIISADIPYAVKTGISEVGEDVFVLGYPLTATMGEEIKLTTGIISSKTGFQGDVSIYQISAPIQPGNSGGPLFDSKGNVIGIVSAKHAGAENVGYAIKTSYLKNLIESAVSSNILPQSNKIFGQSLSRKVQQAKNFVYYITCSSNNTEGEPLNHSTNIEMTPMPQNNYQKYIESAKNGDSEAQFRIGICYYNGDGVEKSLSKAVYWWQIGAEQGDASCEFNLGLSYEKGEGIDRNLIRAAELIKKAALQDMPEAQSKLATYFRDGIGVQKDIKKAFLWWGKAAKQGNVSSQVNLGVCYINGFGIEKNIEKAKYWWEKAAFQGDEVAKKNLEALEKESLQETPNSILQSENKNVYQQNIEAAEKGDSKAQLNIGICYELGNGVAKDYSKAMEWYAKSAEQGNAHAQTCLGICYGMGIGVNKDYPTAIKWWCKAAKQGDDMAQYYMGNCYNYGTGVDVDYSHAALWYQKAAEQGNAQAQFMIGVYYSTGKCFKQNSASAASWWLKAALQDDSNAQFMLGVCYENGEGVEQDKEQSTYWYRKAAKQGHKEAKNKLK